MTRYEVLLRDGTGETLRMVCRAPARHLVEAHLSVYYPKHDVVFILEDS